MRIAILDDIHDAWRHTDSYAELVGLGEVVVFHDRFNAPADLHGFDVLIANRERTRFDSDLLSSLNGIKLIVQTGNHANHIDFDAADKAGIMVAQASAGFSTGAAELTIGLAIACMRQIPQLDRDMRTGNWHCITTPVLHGKTWGIVGLGRIGSHVAKIANAFGTKVVAWSPNLDQARAEQSGASYLPLEELLQTSDVVSVHASLKPSSRDLINGEQLALMKRSAWIINTSRGPVINESALLDALKNKTIAGAGLDVFDQEPLPRDHPFLGLPNVVLTPHIGWPTDDGYQNFAKAACLVLKSYLSGSPFPTFR